MPDLLTHTLINLALPVGALRPVAMGWFAFGGVLPDLVSRVPAIAFGRLLQPGLVARGVDVDWLLIGSNFLHVPLGVGLVVLLLAAGLPNRVLVGIRRWPLAGLIGAGAAIHLALDVMQEHLEPSYEYLYPFSDRPCELGWFDADASLTWLPWLIPIAGCSLLVGRWRRSREQARPDPEVEAGARR